MKQRFIYWIPALCVALVISSFSTHYFSGERTSHFILPILHWLFPSADARTLHWLHTGIRKTAHIAEFGVFSIVVFHGVRAERHGWRIQWAFLTLLVALGYAGLDEWHQSFVPLREARIGDVLIDCTGALLAQVLVWGYARLHRNSPGLPKVADNLS
ncbi:MAG TPA: VanZ family protein [Candidatus Dormibacteraeota bacterium]|jgi:VanZ family protein|nr:VanZ family protein [Candidatus Dormibacteraeota bacterium]